MSSQPYPVSNLPIIGTPAAAGVAFAGRDPADGPSPTTPAFERALHQAIDEEGLLGEALRHHFSARGGFARGRLALDAGAALGLDPALSTDFAVACELLHNASLIHDDLQDRDTLRRGQLTIWARYGEDVAINVGDFLLTRAFETAAAAPIAPEHALAVVAAFTNATTAVIRGQVADNAYSQEPTIDLASYEEIARAKTGPLIALPVQAALAAAGLAGRYAGAVKEAFESAALVYQIQDDLADILHTKQRIRGSDLRAGRPNLVVLLHHRLVDDRILARLEAARALELSRPDRLDVLVAEVATSPAIGHAFDYVEQRLRCSRQAARALPEVLQPLFERTVVRLTAPLAELRSIHASSRPLDEIAVESLGRAEAIPVHV